MRKKITWGGAVLALAMLVSGIAYNVFYSTYMPMTGIGPIRKYSGGAAGVDRALIKKIFNENFYTLTANPDHDLDLMLERRSPNKWETKYFGKMNTYMMYEGDQPAGFVSYYMRTAYQGLILFLAIDSDFRRKGYGKKLVEHAMKELKKQGAKVIKICTRVDNIAAQKLYGGYFGFIKEDEKDGFVFYRKDV